MLIRYKELKEIINNQQYILVDTRTKEEYEMETIEGAYNVPAISFENYKPIRERYKEKDYIGMIVLWLKTGIKEIPEIKQAIKELYNKNTDKQIVFACRNASIRSVLMSISFNILGYKTYILRGGIEKHLKKVIEIHKSRAK